MRVIADKYYGETAENYERDRCKSQRWQNENLAVAAMVTDGPVLDVPLGTGRYVPIYRNKLLQFKGADVSNDMIQVARRKFGAIDAQCASILDLPFADASFATAVCTRLMDWLKPEDMQRAMCELRRVARSIVVTIRHGEERISINYTHSLARFHAAIDGLFIADRRTTEISRHGVEEIFKLRPPVYSDTVAQFKWHGPRPEAEMHRLAGGVSLRGLMLSAEYWTSEKVGAELDAARGLDEAYLHEPEPRFEGQSAVVFEDAHIILDGQRRFNKWRHVPGRYPVLVFRA